MKLKLFTSLIVVSTFLGVAQSVAAADWQEVHSFVDRHLPRATNNTLPETAEYSGKDDRGNACTVSIRRYLLPIIVDISGVNARGAATAGEFGIRDSIVEQFETKNDSWHVTVNNGTAQAPYLNSIAVEQKGNQIKISVTKLNSPKPNVESCTISKQ